MDLPNAPEAEVEVLAAVLQDGRSWSAVQSALAPADFYRRPHRLVAEAMEALFARGSPCDVVTLSQALRDRGTWEEAGGLRMLSQILDARGAVANLGAYLDIVRGKAVERALIQEAAQISAQVASGCDGDIDASIARMGDLSGQRAHRGARVSRANIISGIIQRATDPTIQTSHRVVPTAIAALDAALGGGLRGGWLITIIGHSGAGKTALAGGNFARAACSAGLRTLFVELEMTEEELLTRMLAGISGISSRAFMRRDVTPTQSFALWAAADELAAWRLEIDEGACTLPAICSRARGLARFGGLDLIVVDYLQLMLGSGDDRTADIERVTRGLKSLAKELDVPVVLLSQVTVAAGRASGALGAADGRGAQSIQADSDLILIADNGTRPDGTSVAPSLRGPKFRHGLAFDVSASVRWSSNQVRFVDA